MDVFPLVKADGLSYHLIIRQLKKELSVSSVHWLMKILGFSAQKPLYQAWQQDLVLVQPWDNSTYPAIRA